MKLRLIDIVKDLLGKVLVGQKNITKIYYFVKHLNYSNYNNLFMQIRFIIIYNHSTRDSFYCKYKLYYAASISREYS
jgi:hypothetical protein